MPTASVAPSPASTRRPPWARSPTCSASPGTAPSRSTDARCPARSVSRAPASRQGSTVRPGGADDADLMARRNACPARAERRGHPVDPAARHVAAPRTGTVAVVEFESGPAVERAGGPRRRAPRRRSGGRGGGAPARRARRAAPRRARHRRHRRALHAAHRADPVRRRRAGGRCPRRAPDVGPRSVADQRATGGRRGDRGDYGGHTASPPRRPVAAHAAPGAPSPAALGAARRRRAGRRPGFDVPAAGGPAGDGGADGCRRRGRRRAPQSDVPRALRRRRAGGAGDPPRRPGIGSPAPPSWFGRTPSRGGAVRRRAPGSSPGAGGVRAGDHADDR